MMGNLDGFSMSTMVISSIILALYASEFNPLSDNLTAEVVCTSSMLSAIVSNMYFSDTKSEKTKASKAKDSSEEYIISVQSNTKTKATSLKDP